MRIEHVILLLALIIAIKIPDGTKKEDRPKLSLKNFITTMNVLRAECIYRQEEIQATLTSIATISSFEYAEKVEKALNPRTHLYSEYAYIGLLKKLYQLLLAGMEQNEALDAVQAMPEYSAETILRYWKQNK